jgi:cytoskeletal protein RodZ
VDNKRELRETAISVGAKLKEARDKKSLAIEQVQKATMIHSTVLRALEEGRGSELLTDTYIRSFLKKYAQFLGLDPVEILKEYFPAYPESGTANIPVREKSISPEIAKRPRFLYNTGITVAAIICILLFIFAAGKVISYLKRPKADQQKRAAVSKVKPPQKIKISTKKKSASKQRSEPKELVPRSTPLSLVIRVKEPVLVQLKKDGVLIFERVLTKGLVETIIADDSIELGIGKAEALDLALNGRPIVLPANKVKFGLSITRKGVKVR